jgi:protein-disulfide isomerase|tara:strand:+ start:5710 stop:6438 length:729 start_codon:yes stop_codon:yes gene_type:complete
MEESNKLTIPIAIVIAGVLIAGAVFFISSDKTSPDNGSTDTDTETLRPVSSEDHILGNPDADIVIVEFSDLECPFCSGFHNTMHRIIDEYGKDGSVAWVYRHFPLTQLHPKATTEAEASECAAELGGNQAFWDYIDRIFEITPGNNGLDLDILPVVAEEIGLDRAKFEECLSSGRHRESVNEDLQEAFAVGGRGTPYSIAIVGGEQVPINGNQPYAAIKSFIDSTLLELNSDGTQAVPILEQ